MVKKTTKPSQPATSRHPTEPMRFQLRFLSWLLMQTYVPLANDPVKRGLLIPAGHRDVLQILSPMLFGISISADNIRKLCGPDLLGVRSAFCVGRSLLESCINVLYVMTAGPDVAASCKQHALQKSIRDLQREITIGDATLRHAIGEYHQGSDPQIDAALVAFTTTRGKERRAWTDLTVDQRIDIVFDRLHRQAGVFLKGAMMMLYRHSSELIHGSYFGEAFWLGGIQRPDLQSKTDQRAHFLCLQRDLLEACILSCAAVVIGFETRYRSNGAKFDTTGVIREIKLASKKAGDLLKQDQLKHARPR